MSVVSQVILQADDELRYPTSGELQGLQGFFKPENSGPALPRRCLKMRKRLFKKPARSFGRSVLTLLLRVEMLTVISSVPCV